MLFIKLYDKLNHIKINIVKSSLKYVVKNGMVELSKHNRYLYGDSEFFDFYVHK